MDKQSSSDESPRENSLPVVTGNYAPFRLVMREEDAWAPSLEDISSKTYDYVKLHRSSMGVPVGIEPFSMLVCFDGTFVLPAIETFRKKENALELFNRVLAEILLGGIYVDAMSPDDLGLGSVTFDGYCRMRGGSRGNISSLHSNLRTTYAGIWDSMILLHPRTILVNELQETIIRGRSRMKSIGPLSPDTLLYGSTFYTHHQWAESLIHLWTTAEQIIGMMWREHLINGRTVNGLAKKNRKQFLEDTRTWTSSARIEVLFQKEILPDSTCVQLDVARKARNEFVHTGKRPSSDAARAALEALFQLASLRATGNQEVDHFKEIVGLITEQSKFFIDWEQPKDSLSIEEVKYWMPLPPIPGDSHWGDKPYEVIEELRFVPIKKATD